MAANEELQEQPWGAEGPEIVPDTGKQNHIQQDTWNWDKNYPEKGDLSGYRSLDFEKGGETLDGVMKAFEYILKEMNKQPDDEMTPLEFDRVVHDSNLTWDALALFIQCVKKKNATAMLTWYAWQIECMQKKREQELGEQGYQPRLPNCTIWRPK